MKKLSIIALALAASPATGWSHVVLDQTRAPAGSSYRAVFIVGHGCDGLPTSGISVEIPSGVLGAKPMPKPGWTLNIRTEKLPQPVMLHGKPMDTAVKEITWTAASKEAALPEAYYDEFVLRAMLPATPGLLWFKVTQTCDGPDGKVRKEWAQVPAEGASTQGLDSPAALLKVEAAESGAGHHHH